jgi:hypothetical protein
MNVDKPGRSANGETIRIGHVGGAREIRTLGTPPHPRHARAARRRARAVRCGRFGLSSPALQGRAARTRAIAIGRVHRRTGSFPAEQLAPPAKPLRLPAHSAGATCAGPPDRVAVPHALIPGTGSGAGTDSAQRSPASATAIGEVLVDGIRYFAVVLVCSSCWPKRPCSRSEAAKATAPGKARAA